MNPDPLAREYFMVFDSYVNVEAVVITFMNDTINYSYIGGPFIFADVKTEGSTNSDFFPNPVHSTVTITLKEKRVFPIDVFNIEGKLARHFEPRNPSDTFTIDLTGLPRGEYSIRCNNEIFRIIL
jgi:hypothetical protein